VRLLHGGDPSSELRRSLAAARMEDPIILTLDEQLSLELRSQGFTADRAELPPGMMGQSALDKVLGLRFLTEAEVARDRAHSRRLKGAALVGASVAVLLGAGAAFVVFQSDLVTAESQNTQLVDSQRTAADRLSTLYGERYATLARSESVAVHEELFDLSISLPPQVALISVQKDATGLSAVVERRAGAAPFSRSNLVSALASSPFFAKAEIHEEYEGHLVRYVLKVPRPPAASASAPAAARPAQ